jgi:hypothetical protein
MGLLRKIIFGSDVDRTNLCRKLHKLRLKLDTGLSEEEINRLVDSLPGRKYLGSVELTIITIVGGYARHKTEGGLSDRDAFALIERSRSRLEGGSGVPLNCSLLEFVDYRVSVAYRKKDFVSHEFVAMAVSICSESFGIV